jgi:TatD DNase family protein
MKLIDTHCHLTHGRLRSHLDDVFTRAAGAGVEAVICAAGNCQESADAARLAATREGVYCMAGVHPHDAKDTPDDYLDRIASLGAGPDCVAIGEIGLDYHYNYSPPEDQRRVFAEQLVLAARLGKTIVIHTREAFDDTMSILADSPADLSRAVFHSFSEGPVCVTRVLEARATVSFSGIVTFSRADDIQRSARLVPADRLLVETDSPFLSPVPVRHMKTNEPANVAHVATFLAKLLASDPEQLAARTTANAIRIFGLV